MDVESFNRHSCRPVPVTLQPLPGSIGAPGFTWVVHPAHPATCRSHLKSKDPQGQIWTLEKGEHQPGPAVWKRRLTRYQAQRSLSVLPVLMETPPRSISVPTSLPGLHAAPSPEPHLSLAGSPASQSAKSGTATTWHSKVPR